jgi:uncharacterized damage-inducible protein DinB
MPLLDEMAAFRAVWNSEAEKMIRLLRLEDEPPDLKRPREVKLLAPEYRRVHEQAVARLESLASEQLNDPVTYFDGQRLTIRDVLWSQLLHHLIHHRGQLVLMCRMAGGPPPGLYGRIGRKCRPYALGWKQ